MICMDFFWKTVKAYNVAAVVHNKFCALAVGDV